MAAFMGVPVQLIQPPIRDNLGTVLVSNPTFINPANGILDSINVTITEWYVDSNSENKDKFTVGKLNSEVIIRDSTSGKLYTHTEGTNFLLKMDGKTEAITGMLPLEIKDTAGAAMGGGARRRRKALTHKRTSRRHRSHSSSRRHIRFSRRRMA
jgi:hypothetical protein